MNKALAGEPSVEQRKLLDLHLRLVIAENKKTNLTRITDWDSAQVLHVEDSLVGLQEFNEAPEGPYLDMGTGAGYPGLPLAVMSDRCGVLADSVGKKTKAVDSFISALGLESRVSTFNGRIEDLAREKAGCFAVVTARALSSLPSLLELASPLLMEGGWLICYKAPGVHEEVPHVQEIEDKLGFKMKSMREALLSDGETCRVMVVYEKIHEATVPLPRRVGVAQKRPY